MAELNLYGWVYQKSEKLLEAQFPFQNWATKHWCSLPKTLGEKFVPRKKIDFVSTNSNKLIEFIPIYNCINFGCLWMLPLLCRWILNEK